MQISDVFSNIEHVEDESALLAENREEEDTRIETLQKSVTALERDAEVAARVEKTLEEARTDREQTEEQIAGLSARLSQIDCQLQAFEEQAAESMAILSELEMLGEDVSAGKQVIKEREQIISECRSRLDEIRILLGLEGEGLESADVNTSGLNGSMSDSGMETEHFILSEEGETPGLNENPDRTAPVLPGLFEPENLDHTRQTWKQEEDGSLVFDSPVETGKKLDQRQGKVSGFRGTCGCVCCVNILRMAGVPVSEADIVHFASTTPRKNKLSLLAGKKGHYLCATGYRDDAANGGTTAADRKEILEYFGTPSYTAKQDIDTIAEAVASGRGVICSVYADSLYSGRRTTSYDLHAITVTSVKRGADGELLGFYICDSDFAGPWDSSALYVEAEYLKNALSHKECNITSSIIR